MAIKHVVAAFVMLIIGIALLGEIVGIVEEPTEFRQITNESITIIKSGVDVNETWVYQLASSPTGWKTDGSDCVLSDLVLGNSTDSTAWTITTDYTVTLANGTLLLVNTSTTQLTANNLSYASYKYCGDDYLNSSWGRTTLKLVGGFIAIALLLVSVGIFYNIARENNIV